jgi:hypothetical protein
MVESAKVFDFKVEKFNLQLRRDVEESLEPVAGDPTIHTMGDSEIMAFCNMVELQWKLEEFHDIMKDRIAERSTKMMRASMDGLQPQELFEMAQDINVFENDREAYDYFHALALYEYRNKDFVWTIRVLTDNFTHRYDIRQGFKVVRLAKRYS